MITKQPIKKSDWDNVQLGEWTPKLSYVRFSNGQIHPKYEPYQRAREFWPNLGIYKPKMIRK